MRDAADQHAAEETAMAKIALGMSKPTLIRTLAANAGLFGLTGVLAPRVLETVYGIPPSPHSRQLLRLFGSRMLVLAAWSYTARTDEEANRALGAGVAMNVIDTLTALSAARATGGTAVRGAVTSAAFAGILAAVRSLDD
jgi:hypothetical protein